MSARVRQALLARWARLAPAERAALVRRQREGRERERIWKDQLPGAPGKKGKHHV